MLSTILIIVAVCIVVVFLVIRSIKESKEIKEYWESREKQAGAGDADAKFRLAESYANSCSQHKALQWYKLAADINHGDSCYRLAWCYMIGIYNVVEKNQELARLYLDKALLLDSPRAYNQLGNWYKKGLGGAVQSNEEAFKYYNKAAAQGLAAAQYNLAWCYRDGVGVYQSETESKKWFKLAADQGYDYMPMTIYDDPTCKMFSFTGCR